ncbi:pyocin S6 family toxin immunity protein [Pseudomonas syringae]|jgi:hypothetical protein|uniref:Uncharacterized protein n=1 Tax=Pseudomonas syringae TaxID=317 RepID=A0A085V2L0_PSESX|nr:pyocin S6 family toxin immunity protein [Pseudomonas syringae]KFE49673.1 hypothetical protein IV02_18955 [Pseudomonas syringae]
MTFILVRGFYPEPDPDDSLQYEKVVPQDLETKVLAVMNWASLKDVPVGVTEFTAEQAKAVMALLDDPVRDDLIYCTGLYR